jgi:transposase
VTTIVEIERAHVGGVDTHADVHVAAVIDPQGGLLGVESFRANPDGYKDLSVWMRNFGTIGMVGVEGTGSYGAGLSRHLRSVGLVVVEVDRQNRQARRRQGKSDPLDAVEAARAAQSGRAFGTAKTRDGSVEAIRALMVARRSARESRTKAMNQIRQLIYTAPDELRERFIGTPPWRLAEGVALLRVHADTDQVRMATKTALATLGRRAVALDEEGSRLDALIARLVDSVAPELVQLVGVGYDTAALLLIAAGDNPSRLRSEATWAKLCGVSPLECLLGQGDPSSAEPRRRPPGQSRALAHRAEPHVVPRTDQDLRCPSHYRGQVQERDHAHTQALRCPGGLPLPAPGIAVRSGGPGPHIPAAAS